MAERATSLRVLIVEDSEDDTILVLRELRHSGFEVVSARVDTPEGLQAALETAKWDCIICDYSMPRFDGLAALRLVRQVGLDLPFVIVSGNIGEEVAVEAMRAGAHDYVMKDNLARLGPAVRRELHEADVRHARKLAEAENDQLYRETRRQADRLAALLEIANDVSATLDLATVLTRIATHARDLLDADDSDLYLLQPDGRTLRPIVSLGSYSQQTLALPLELGEGIVGWVAQSGVAEVINRADRDPRAVQVPGTPPEPCAILCAPLLYRERLLGIMAMARFGERGAFSQADLDFLVNLARQAAIAIENARLYADEQRRTEELGRALWQQRELDRMRDEFIQNVSHELRTPVTIIQGYADLLNRGELGELRPEHQQVIEVIARRVSALCRLVDDLTAVLQTRSGEFGHTPIDLGHLIEDVMIDFRPAAEQAQLVMISEVEPGLPPLRGNVDYIRRMLDNLVGNAIKFTPAGGTVTVRLCRQDEHLVLRVTDTGLGIPAGQQDRIFDRFYQVDGGTARRFGGTGLGLALVKDVVLAHNGEISVNSVEGKGSTFQVTLPAVF